MEKWIHPAFLISAMLIGSGCDMFPKSVSHEVGLEAPVFSPSPYSDSPRIDQSGTRILYYRAPYMYENGTWAFSNDTSGVWIYDMPSGANRKLADGLCAIWGPQDEWIVINQNGSLRKYRIDGIEIDWESQVVLTLGGSQRPEWNFGRNLISFTSLTDTPVGAGGTYTIRPDGTGLTRVYDAGFGHSWHPDGDIIYLDRPSSSINALRHIVAYDVALSKPAGIYLRDDALSVSFPQISKDGSKVLFFSSYKIYIHDIGLNTLIYLTDGRKAPSWSNDGRYVLYGRNDGIYKYDIQSKAEMILVKN